MNDPPLLRVHLGDEWDKSKMMDIFRKTLRLHGLLREDLLYHAFDGVEALDRVTLIGCDVENPEHYSCGTMYGINDRRSQLYNPLDTGLMLEKPGLLVYKKLSLVCIDKQASIYRFRGKNYWRALVAILLAKRPRSNRSSDIHPDV